MDFTKLSHRARDLWADECVLQKRIERGFFR